MAGEDPLPGLIAGFDQMLAMAPELARVAHGYFTAFREQGFSDSQAIYLAVCQMQGSPGEAPTS